MKLSMQIFADWLKNYQPKADITSNQFEIEAVRLFSPDVRLNENTLYIGRLRDLFKNGNDRVICTHRNDILLLNTTDLEEILNCVLDALTFYTHWDSIMMNLLTSGAMLQDLFDASQQILGHPAFLLDPYQRHLAHTANYGIGDVDEPWDYILEQGSCDMDFLLRFNATDPGRIHRKGIYSYETSLFPHNAYHYNFSLQGNFLGSATVIALPAPMTEGALNCFSLFCTYIQKWFEIHIQEQQSLILDTQLRTVISDANADPRDLCRRLLLLGWQETDTLIFIKLDALLEAYNIHTHLCHSLRIAFPHILAVTADLSVCLLCNLSQCSLEETCHRLLPWLQNSKYYATLGKCFTLSDPIYHHYRFASITSQFVEKEAGQIYEGTRHVLPYLFSQLKGTIIPTVLHPALHLLREYDAQHSTEFYETLYLYLKNERSIANTARAMNLPRNTLLYRLKRLDELTGENLDDDMERLHLLLSFEMEKAAEYA